MFAPLQTRLPWLLLATSHLPTSLASSPTSSNYKARRMATGPPALESGIALYSYGTPNGLKINVALEELKSLGSPLTWVEHTIDISQNVQKQPWFLAEINPNGRIPAIVDYNRGAQRVFETGSILLYLSRWYDGEKYLLHFEDDRDETEMISWIFFQHGGYGTSLPSKRLLQVYETRLAEGEGRDYLVGEGRGKFSYASFSWIRAHPFSLSIPSLTHAGFPLLDSWIRRIEARPGAAKAVEGDMVSRLKGEVGWEEKVREKGRWVWEEEDGQKEERKRDEL
uniref:BY PROTMAP: gi/472580529/gb/EMS18321.1/ Glutathione S-transferase [Rhodosporidium toruloides NP11] gi/647401902/emb/CDR48257.1/ RHTO0S16e04676g1_1 [Rhodosporidium toruloides] n=1 Tax=Rhodotorula toruloides TaxID=5286 RepID=A0A0K3CMV8_RHOTO